MAPEKQKAAHTLGVRMFQTDDWLRNALHGAAEALKAGGKEALLLVVRDLAFDDHFDLNWMPLIKREAGAEDPQAFLSYVWHGYADAYMDGISDEN